MTNTRTHLALATLTAFAALGSAAPATAQVAGGSTTVETSVTESTRLAMGWSVKKTLLGKTIYNDAGQKVGEVEDLIIAPDRNVSYVIVGAGGFVGIGRHDVAIPVSQIQDRAGRLVMPGATQETIKSLPEFAYVADTSKRDAFVAAADRDIAKGRAALAGLEKKAGAANADAKARIDVDISALQLDLKSAEDKLAEMKQAGTVRWREFETGVGAATARLRKSTDKTTG
ncbi:PRC-barrel domain-containing protein [Rubrivivax gelatinosus]|uniref:Photosystem reaction center protein H n=1 Tax=Rubrivivax gelatinosus TaxID=28068 RepID=A0ABS1DT48_RUBGE|nr:PRC-barrel domain-containing protein [Rubrivivax gelatinosus]MBK1712658.1 photosystem reaction center protein H [Rubrivivax gelatinosus]